MNGSDATISTSMATRPLISAASPGRHAPARCLARIVSAITTIYSECWAQVASDHRWEEVILTIQDREPLGVHDYDALAQRPRDHEQQGCHDTGQADPQQHRAVPGICDHRTHANHDAEPDARRWVDRPSKDHEREAAQVRRFSSAASAAVPAAKASMRG